ncbi:chromate transporter [Domibacillus enclensis]|uniref:Chromate transporter n=1 Tax=Domibacillus enclensis TaxID=1017273 RepID=A0A1N6Z4X0_9BACI|nr:chromate transporter [Domibacillus enclensis]OXS76593.1 chromate transporter [Domibacillus enclensis]SIR21902.1 chromate transporter [Domibacillus enclensis]
MMWLLFKTFFVIGLVSFGGGYAIIPVIKVAVVRQGWMNTQTFTDVVAIAGMSPGPIATNTAVFTGFQVNGLSGAAVAALAMVLPSLILVLVVASFFGRLNHNRTMKAVFYGLRPVVIALILFAAVTFALSAGMTNGVNTHTASLVGIFLFSLFLLVKRGAHPAYVIGMAGLLGMAFYS